MTPKNSALTRTRKTSGPAGLGLLLLLIFFPLMSTAASNHHHEPSAACESHDQDDHGRENHAEHLEQESCPPDDHAPGKHEEDCSSAHDHEQAHNENETEPHDYVHLDPEMAARFGIAWAPAGDGRLAETISAPGTVAFNRDQLTRITPQVGGIVTEVLKKLGDQVKHGEVVAIINSRELAEIRSAFLRAREDCAFREQIFRRERQMRRTGANAEAELQAAARDYRLADIELALQQRKLLDLGFSREELTNLKPSDRLSEFQLRAPRTGEIIERQVITGDVIAQPRPLFTVADLSTVWVDLEVAAADAGRLTITQKVFLTDLSGRQLGQGNLSYVAPMLNETSRTRKARLSMPASGLRPGSFIQGRISIPTTALSPVLLKRGCLREVDGRTVVFVKDEHGFRLRPVETGREDEHQVEILSGLKPGEEVVIEGSFHLKAELETGLGGGCTSPGHSH